MRELAKLGGSLFLAFAPSIIVISVLFTVLYAVRMAGCVLTRRQILFGAEHSTVSPASVNFIRMLTLTSPLQMYGDKFVHTGNSRMHVPEYVVRSL